jgi:hypothetical protein
MPETDSHHPGLGPLRAAAETAELAHAASGLASAYGYRLADRDPPAPLARISRHAAIISFTWCAQPGALGRARHVFASPCD